MKLTQDIRAERIGEARLERERRLPLLRKEVTLINKELLTCKHQEAEAKKLIKNCKAEAKKLRIVKTKLTKLEKRGY